MFYEFEDAKGYRRVVRSTVADLPSLIERMKREGWRRLYSLPNVYAVPNYHEALEETHGLVADDSRKRAVSRAEAKQNLAEALKDEI